MWWPGTPGTPTGSPNPPPTALLCEWDRCRWVWSECVAASSAQGTEEMRRVAGQQLTQWRTTTSGYAQASVPQQPTIRDFAKSAPSTPGHQGACRTPTRRDATVQEEGRGGIRPNYTRRGFSSSRDVCTWPGASRSTRVMRDLPPSRKRRVYRDLGHWYASFVVPAAFEPLPETGKVIGVDWGVRRSQPPPAYDLPHAEHGKNAARSWPATSG